MMIKNWLTKEFFVNLLKTDVKKWNELTSKITKCEFGKCEFGMGESGKGEFEKCEFERGELGFFNMAFVVWKF